MCVYLHLDSSGLIRYVGSGTKDRPHNFNIRSKEWYNVFGNNPPTVVIVEDNLEYDDAIYLENYLYYSCKDSILNTTEPRPVKDLNFDSLNEWFYIDVNSPSGLRVKKKHKNNARTNVGDVAGKLKGRKTGKVYWEVSALGKRFLAHRVVYLLLNGTISKHMVINHIDGNGLNNNPENLEQVTHSVNSIKKLTRNDNKIGINGLTYCFYKNQEEAIMAKLKLNTLDKHYQQRFSYLVFGDKEEAMSSAIRWRKYMLHMSGIELIDDISVLKENVLLDLQKISKIRSSSLPFQYKSGEWYCRIRPDKHKPYIYTGRYKTKGEAILARDKLVDEYNSNLVVSLPL